MGTEEIQKAVEEEVAKRTDIETHDTSRVVKTLFTDKETITMARSLANCLREKARLESDLASVKKSFAGDIGKQDAEISALQEKMNTGWEMRRQDCVETRDFRVGMITVTVKSTGEIVAERAMNFEERQMNLPITGKPGEVVDAEFGTGITELDSTKKLQEEENLKSKQVSTSVTDVFGGTHEIAPQTTVENGHSDAEASPETTLVGNPVGEDAETGNDGLETQKEELAEDQNPFYADRPPIELNGKGGKKGRKSLKLA